MQLISRRNYLRKGTSTETWDAVERIYESVESGATIPPNEPIQITRSHLVYASIARSSTPAYDCLT